MGTAILKLRIMPDSPDANLEEIKENIKNKLEPLGGVLNPTNPFEEQPIAFGLKAIIATFAWPEEKDTDLAENTVSEIDNVSSVEITDYRRAVG